MTPEQTLTALANIINLGILASVAWLFFFDWVEDRYIEPWKERLRQRAKTGHDTNEH